MPCSKCWPLQRNAMAPCVRQTPRSTSVAAQLDDGAPRALNHGRTCAVLGKGLDLQRHRRKTSVRQPPDTADRIAGHTRIQAGVLRCSRVRTCGQPFLDREGVTADERSARCAMWRRRALGPLQRARVQGEMQWHAGASGQLPPSQRRPKPKPSTRPAPDRR